MEQQNKLPFSAPSVLVTTTGDDAIGKSEDWGMGGVDTFSFRNWSSGVADLDDLP